MAYVYGDGSYFDERTKGFDSAGLSASFKVQRDMVAFGTLSANDLTDWYQLNSVKKALIMSRKLNVCCSMITHWLLM